MSLKSMKLSKKDKKEEKLEVGSYEGPDYPWGLNISLNNDSMEKLGISTKELKIGTEVVISARAKVTSISENQWSEREKSQRAELQITKMEISDANNAENAFNEEGD